MIPQPLIVLAPPFGDSSRVAAILGGHPDACLLPELHLTMAGSVGDLLDVFAVASGGYEYGLLRTVAEWFCGGQNEAGVDGAWEWLRRRADRSCEMLLWEFAERIAPRQIVLPDSSAGWRPDTLRLLAAMFPGAPWLHLLMHPRVYSAATIPQLRGRLHIAPDFRDHRIDTPLLDPQVAWYRVHLNIDNAISQRVGDPSFRLRAEQLYAVPEDALTVVCDWLGWEATPSTIAAMLQPQAGPFAMPGPIGAPGGLEEDFIQSPWFVRKLRPMVSLDGPLEWRPDGLDFADEVKSMATQFGYC